jgi:hypothetical protein
MKGIRTRPLFFNFFTVVATEMYEHCHKPITAASPPMASKSI